MFITRSDHTVISLIEKLLFVLHLPNTVTVCVRSVLNVVSAAAQLHGAAFVPRPPPALCSRCSSCHFYLQARVSPIC